MPKSNAQKLKEDKARKKAKGLVRREYWATLPEHDALKALWVELRKAPS